MDLFGTSGIRGTVGEVVTADLALSIGRALPALEVSRVVIGRDPRVTGELLVDALAAGARECGVDVVDLGLVATPTVARSVAWTDADLGVVVTASHNPPSDNGFKLWGPSGRSLGAAERQPLVDALEAGSPQPRPWDETGDRSAADVTGRHRSAITDGIDDLDGLHVAVDLGNGAGRLTVDALETLGATVTPINHRPDGRFPNRPSEPTAETCEELCETVGSTSADLGIAHDGDADRMMAVTETGEFVPGDVILALFARATVSSGDRVAAPVNTSRCVDDALEPIGASVTRTRIGDVHVAERASEPDVVFGGEPSGTWIWPEETLCPDGPLAACRLAELVAANGSFDRLVGGIEPHPLKRESVEVAAKHERMRSIRSRITDAYPDRSSTKDGVHVAFDDGWFLVRPSGTEPLLRITAEGKTKAIATAHFERAKEYVLQPTSP